MAGWAYALFFLSGCASLIYEVVWTRQLTLLLGSTTYAITTVVVCFMLGLALGSHVGGAVSRRLRRPGRVYAGLEAAIGLYALLVPLLMTAANPAYRGLYPHAMNAPWLLTLLRFCVSAVVLLVPTTCMGATLPVLMAQVTRGGRLPGRSAGWLYGINTMGAAAGCMLAGFWLMPAVGLSRTTWVAAGINGLVAVVGWMALGAGAASAAAEPTGVAKHGKKTPQAAWLPPGAWAIILAAAGLSGVTSMMYQIAWTRALVLSIGSSTYSFTCILAAFIMGLGLGSLAIARYADRLSRPLAVLGLLELGIGVSAVLIVPIHGRIPLLVEHLVNVHCQEYGTLLGLMFLLVVAVTAAPTFLMGAAFPLMTRMASQKYSEAGEAVGRVYVVNTGGTVLGCLLTGFVLIRGEVLGARGCIAAAATVNAMLGVWLLHRARASGWSLRGWLLAGGGIAAVLAVGIFSRWDLALLTSAPFRQPDQPRAAREVLRVCEGVDVTVTVERPVGQPDSLSLRVNGKPDASTTFQDMRTQLLLGHLPALLKGNGKQACVIGLGCGMTLDAVARHPTYERLDCVEISDAVIEAAKLFAPYTRDILRCDPRVRLVRADGRNHLLLSDRAYDLIISEPSNPWISGESSLFTREFFQICKQRLSPGGRLAIWMHAYAMPRADFRMVARTLCEVFDFVSLWQLMHADYCFIAGNGPFRAPAGEIMERYAREPVRLDLCRAGIHDLGGVLGSFIAAGPALRDWAAGARLHTDDNARLEFSAPRGLYRDESLELASELLRIQSTPFDAVVSDPGDSALEPLRTRVAQVIDARRGWAVGLRQLRENALGEALKTMIESYQRDPGDVQLFEVLDAFCKSPASEETEAARAFAKQIERLPSPAFAHPRGTTATEYARGMQQMAEQAPGAFAAVYYLRLAHELAPENGEIVSSLARALARLRDDPAYQALTKGNIASGPAK